MIDFESNSSTSFHHDEISSPADSMSMSMSMDLSTIYSNVPLYQGFGKSWQHAMKSAMQEIVPGVFLGPYKAAVKTNRTNLMLNGITHIVCVRQEMEANFIRPHFQDMFTYLTLDIADVATENLIPVFPKVKQFIEECLDKKGKVLIHGNGGISRSATLCLAYVMEKYGLSCKDAYRYVKERRGCIKPNNWFVSQLSEYEPIYRARETLNHGQSSSDARGRKKRKSDQLEVALDMEPIPPPPSPVTDFGESYEMCIA